MAPQLTRLLTPMISTALGLAASAIGLPPSIRDISLRFARNGPGSHLAPNPRRRLGSMLHRRSPGAPARPREVAGMQSPYLPQRDCPRCQVHRGMNVAVRAIGGLIKTRQQYPP